MLGSGVNFRFLPQRVFRGAAMQGDVVEQNVKRT